MGAKRIWLLPAVILLSAAFSSCTGKAADQKMYEEIMATMSAEKAKKFFQEFPQSRYRERLVQEMIGWCRQEKSKECYELILDALPKDHSQYGEIRSYYQEHFKKKR